MATARITEFWQIDVRLVGEWKTTPHSMGSLDLARNRADAVFHWATVRVSNVVSRETWSREPGRGWVKAEPAPPPAPPAPPPADPRSPMRAPENATRPPENVWYRKGDME